MKALAVLLLIGVVGCAGSSPTAPTPTAVSPLPPTPSPPAVAVPSPPFPPTDARFNLTFYRQLAHNALESPSSLAPLRRQREAPRVYLRTVYDSGAPVDAVTLDTTAAALINTAGALTGRFGLAGMERGTGTHVGEAGWITVVWSSVADTTFCGTGSVGGTVITFYPLTANCACAGSRIKPVIVKHELGHALGFWHTDSREDLMFNGDTACDKSPSAREQYHAALAYDRPIGSAAP